MQAAADWLAAHGPGLEAVLAPLMPGLIADGMFIGAVSAQAVTGSMQVAKAKPKGGLNPKAALGHLNGWKPGETVKAGRFLGDLGLHPDPRQAAEAAAKLAGGIRTVIGRALVEGAQADAAPAETGKKAFQGVTDKVKAAAAVLDQITSGSAQAASHWYLKAAVYWVEWQTEDDDRVCAVCQANEDAGPVKLGEPFPSGDTEPTAHPRCRCALLPAGWVKPPPQLPQPPAKAPAAAAPAEPEPFTPLQFTSPAGANQWLKDNRADWTPEQKQAAEWYTGSGSDMTNRRLRQGTAPAALPEDVLGVNIRAEVAALDSAMSPLPASLVLDRVVGADAFGGEDKIAALAGKVITDRAYQSASLGGPSLGRQGVLMHIAAPEGTPAVIVGNRFVQGEREVLLARGTELAVSRVEEVDGRWHVWAMVIPK